MPAPVGNKFYELVKMPTGRPKKYTPKTLWETAQEYFKWVDENPLMERKVFNYQGEIVEADLPKMRAMTETAFCLFAEIDLETFSNYKSKKEPYEDFFGVSIAISQIIYTQKMEGAAADFLNANIIARDLGLRERTETEVKGVEAIRIIRDSTT
jgi:hypothetical protein